MFVWPAPPVRMRKTSRPELFVILSGIKTTMYISQAPKVMIYCPIGRDTIKMLITLNQSVHPFWIRTVNLVYNVH